MDDYDEFDDFDLDDAWLYAEDEYDLAVSPLLSPQSCFITDNIIGRTGRKSNRRPRICRHQL